MVAQYGEASRSISRAAVKSFSTTQLSLFHSESSMLPIFWSCRGY